MVKRMDLCDDCAPEGYHCMGQRCPKRNVPVLCCDQCGEPITTGYKLDDEVYCEDCILGELETVTQEDFCYAYNRELEEEEKERRLLC